jgi:hypothetical protein
MLSLTQPQKYLQKYFLFFLLFSSLIACKQSDHSVAQSISHSANAVKIQESTLDLKPLQGLEHQTFTAFEAYQAKKSKVFIEDQGTVAKLLPDDNKGARHQKFLVKIATGQTLLFAHNIDLAPRIENIAVGDTVIFRGEYVYNPKGGVIHWTHHDPKNKMIGGWIKHQDQEYK